MTDEIRIAMWSGPRNISTAMMRAWENRPDTSVWDEPLYAYYLAATGIDHPGRDDIIRAGETHWPQVVAACLGPIPDDRPIYFLKHMTHHLLPEVDRGWLAQVRNCFLIRDPREVIASYARVRSEPTLDDVGICQQMEIVRQVQTMTGQVPLILEARDILEDPRAMMHALCEALGCPFSESMLSWPAGPRRTDGVWAPYWYASVEASTGFAAPRDRSGELPPPLRPLAERAMADYEQLLALRLRP